MAKDLCLGLLKLDPTCRLGAGKAGTVNSYEMLKAHPFFKGVDFANLSSKKPPLKMDFKTQSLSQQTSLSAAIDATTDDSIKEEIKNATPICLLKETTKDEPVTVKDGVLEKKCGWIFRKRKLILTSQPRLSYYEADGIKYKVCELARVMFL